MSLRIPLGHAPSEAEIIREDRMLPGGKPGERRAGEPGLLRGQITPGEVFAWEPDIPGAAELIVVSRITGTPEEIRIWSWDFPNYQKEIWNDLSRFREACFRTRFRTMPTSRPPEFSPVPLPLELQKALEALNEIVPKKAKSDGDGIPLPADRSAEAATGGPEGHPDHPPGAGDQSPARRA